MARTECDGRKKMEAIGQNDGEDFKNKSEKM